MKEPTIIDHWRLLFRHKVKILSFVFVVTSLTIAFSYTIPKTYKADVLLIPIGGPKTGTLASMASQAGLGNLLGAMGGGANSSLQIIAILKSRTLAEKVIQKCDLMKKIFKKDWDEVRGEWKKKDPEKQPRMEDAVKALSKLVTFKDDKRAQTIGITSIFGDPELAARVANVYVEELAEHLRDNTFTVAKRNRIFIESRLEGNRADLLQLGKKISLFYSMNKVSNVVPMVDVNVSPSGDLPPEPIRDLEELQKKTEELEGKVEELRSKMGGSDPDVVQDVPQQVYLQYLMLQRELQGQVNMLLTQQYELAKLEEAREDLNFQIVDPAVVPFRKYGPKKKVIVLAAFFLSFGAAVGFLYFREYLRKESARA